MSTDGNRPPVLPISAGGLIYTAFVFACATAVVLAMAVRSDASTAPTPSAPTHHEAAPTHAAAKAVPLSLSAHPPSVSVPSAVTANPTTGDPALPIVPVVAPGTGCAAALSYLSANAAPGFQLICPGYADGAQALTCVGDAPCAPNQRMIVIADPCPAAYMNEAHNSWVLDSKALGTPIPGGDPTIDPFGHC